jgi:hypothetical protein
VSLSFQERFGVVHDQCYRAVTARHYVLDLVNRAESLNFWTQPTITLVTKSLDVALLRTCHFVYAEAKPFVTATAKQEPSRYIINGQSVKTLDISEECIFGRIRATEETVRSIADHADDAPMQRFLSKCASWNKCAHPDLHSPRAAPARYSRMRVAIPGPYRRHSCTDEELPTPAQYAWLGPFLRVNKTREAVFVIQAGVGEERSHNADFCKELERKVMLLTALYRLEQGKRQYRVEILEEEKWKMKWEKSHVPQEDCLC